MSFTSFGNTSLWVLIKVFPSQADSADICCFFQLYMKQLDSWWLRGLEILLVAIPYMFPSIFLRSSYVSFERFLMFDLALHQFLRVFVTFFLMCLSIYEAKSTPKVDFSLYRIRFCGNVWLLLIWSRCMVTIDMVPFCIVTTLQSFCQIKTFM